MAARFRIDQVTPGQGILDRSRHDLVPGEIISLVVPAPVTGATYSWEILDQVGSDAALTATTGTSTSIGSSGSIDYYCAFTVQLTETLANGTVTKRVRTCSVRSQAAGLRPVMFGELADRRSTKAAPNPDACTDNALYSDLAGTGVAGQNWRGWVEAFHEMSKAIETVAAATTGFTAHASEHILSGTMEIDGDKLGVDFVPGSGYTRTTTSPTSTNVKHLTSHLNGIAAAIAAASLAASTAASAAATAQAAADAHASRHLRGGADAIDADQLGIDLVPTNYTRASSTSVSSHVEHLAGHLSGIDSALSPYLTHVTENGTSHTFALTDAFQTIDCTSASTTTITFPLNATIPYPVGTVIRFYRAGTGALTFAATGGGITVRAPDGLTVSAQYKFAFAEKIATNEWLLSGSLQ